jgi:HEPN domain-containing protein
MATFNEEGLHHALTVLELTLPLTKEQLDQKRRELLHAWYPARYANLTNNPKKYMQMYKQAEEMTKKVEGAYELVARWLATVKS